jgi:tetratricopeptide (TPR) repeat protein
VENGLDGFYLKISIENMKALHWGLCFTKPIFRIRIVRMMTENLDETHPIPVEGDTLQTPVHEASQQPPEDDESPLEEIPAPKKRKRASWFWWLLLAIFTLIGVVAVSGLMGYWNGIRIRQEFEATQVAIAVDEYFNLGLQNMEEGRFYIAQQQFQYVIELDPNYPGATGKLAEVMLILNTTATPTPAPTTTPTPIPITPTPDMRGEAEIYAQAEDFVHNEDWGDAIEALESLRKLNPEYRAIDIDGMLYLALRQRGVQKISEGNLEGGIYDLSLAERFGILDTEADSWRTWSQYYIRGASFWEVDWERSVYYFEQVAPMFPNMHDGSFWTASQRYKEALTNYAQWLDAQGSWCEAEEQYIVLRDYTGDSSLDETIDEIADKCR